MAQLGFQAWKAPRVESGELRASIRAPRRDGRDPKLGDTLKLFEGLRTKHCRSLGWATCTSAEPIRLVGERVPPCGHWGQLAVYLSGRRLSYADSWALALADGFDSLAQLFTALENIHGEQFADGVLIQWGTLRPPDTDERKLTP